MFDIKDKELKEFLRKELVGLNEIKEIMEEYTYFSSRSRQRAYELTQRSDFPKSLPLQLVRGRLWFKTEVLEFFDHYVNSH